MYLYLYHSYAYISGDVYTHSEIDRERERERERERCNRTDGLSSAFSWVFHGANSIGWQECPGCRVDALEALAADAADPWSSSVHASYGGGVSC